MKKVKIYQGTQIGGCVTVISSVFNGETHRIMIDYGSSLPGCEVKEDFTYPWKDEPVDAVFFTHYHGDHVGRITEIPPEIPLYMGPVTRKAMINIEEALANSKTISNPELHKRELEILNDDERVNTFNYNGISYDSIDIPGFHIEPYSVDHSAYDAYMFLVEAEDASYKDGKYRILHTGDFRGHGRRGHKMLTLINAYVREFGERSIDALVIEGTMMSRSNENVLTEPQMQWEAAKYLKDHKYAFLICSSTNVDSLASFYQAAQMAGGRKYGRWMYVYSSYFKKQLKLYTETAGSFSPVYKFEKIELLEKMSDTKQNERMKEPVSVQKLMEDFGFIAVIKPAHFCEKYIDMFIEAYNTKRIKEKPVLIYSMWEGYLDPTGKAKNQELIDFISRQKGKGIEVKCLHTSGHATPKMIENVIKAVDPQDAIYRIHTESAESFDELNIGDLKEQIVPLDDESYVN